MYTIRIIHGFMAQALEGSNAATLGPLNLHRARERKNGRTKGEQDHHGNGNRSRNGQQEPPAILQAVTVSAPSASTPGSTSRATRTDHRRTGGPPHQHRTSTGGREDRQTDTERREGPATPGHGETPGQHRKQESNRNGSRHGHGHEEQPPPLDLRRT